ncbi:MAG: hypothetical protein IJS15_06715, partial [Victivallales bacterium]|nr:hypothetical protein [Victivallales bacterium]
MKLDVPQIASTDLLLVGGSLKGLLLALAARQHGHSVYCITPFPYFAEEYTSHFDLQGHDDVVWKTVFPEGGLLTPMDVKRRVEQLLISSGIDFIYQVNPVCPVFDDDGDMAGLIVADRSGFQAIQAKVIVDATENSLVARACGLPMRPFRPGVHKVTRYQLNAANGASVETLPLKYQLEGKEVPVIKVVEQLEITDGSAKGLAQAEVVARLRTWHPDKTYGSDVSIIEGLPTVSPDYRPSCSQPLYLANRVNEVELLEELAKQQFRKMSATNRKHIDETSEIVCLVIFNRFWEFPWVEFDLDTFA